MHQEGDRQRFGLTAGQRLFCFPVRHDLSVSWWSDTHPVLSGGEVPAEDILNYGANGIAALLAQAVKTQKEDTAPATATTH